MDLRQLTREPDHVRIETDTGTYEATRVGTGFEAQGVFVELAPLDQGANVSLRAPTTPVRLVQLRWRLDMPSDARVLGDHWERGYGDLEWRGMIPERVLPWYALLHTAGRTYGFGVKTGANCFAFWQVDAQGISLGLNTRSGGVGVELGDRVLDACAIVPCAGDAGESPRQVATRLCRRLCPSPRLPSQPVYGGNDWYYAYGGSCREQAIRDAELVSELSPSRDNRPFMVLDDGWQIERTEAFNGGPWNDGNARFPDMPGLAGAIGQAGARPGLWFRPLLTNDDATRGWRLTRPGAARERQWILDPSRPEVLDYVRRDTRRLVDWGYELIKHDWTTHDILGRWGFQMDALQTAEGWAFADRFRTTAEIVLDLYRAIRAGAGEALIIGCNTVGHLAAGLFELQRTGDDTSGESWERTRRMGINTLAFRMCQHNTFFAHDADCVGLTERIPWALNRQWLELLAASGTPLFVSAGWTGREQRAALHDAFRRAAEPQTPAEPLDWMETTCPRAWRQGEEDLHFTWLEERGAPWGGC